MDFNRGLHSKAWRSATLFLLFNLFFQLSATENAFAKKIKLRAVDQFGKSVPGAMIKVKGYGNAPAGKSVNIPVGRSITFSGSISGLKGGALTKKVDSSVRELIYPFKRVKFFSRDQNGRNIAGSTILVKGYRIVKNGSSLTVPLGITLDFKGKLFGVEGEYLKKRVEEGVDEVVYPFLTLPFRAKDQSGRLVPRASAFISGYGTVENGGNFSVPYGATIRYTGRLERLEGDFVLQDVDNSLKELVYPFRTVRFITKDQHGKVLKNGRVFVSGFGIISSGDSITFPREAQISYKVDVLSPSVNMIGSGGSGKGAGNYKIDYRGNASSTYSKDKAHSRISEIIVPVVMDFGIPVADAGTERVLIEKGRVKMDGSQSYSPGGSPLSYVWTQTSGKKVKLVNSMSSKPEFVVPVNLPVDEDLTFQLIVYDGEVKSKPDVVVIKVKDNKQLLASKKSADEWGDF